MEISKKNLLLTGGVFFLIKLLSLYYISVVFQCDFPEIKLGAIALASGDTFSYTEAMENYLQYGEYFFMNENNEKVLAGRLPHYSLPYFFLRQFLEVRRAYDVLVILQLAVETMTTLYFCVFIGKLLNSSTYFYLSLLFFGLSFYTSWFAVFASPESFSVSLLMMFIATFYDYTRTHRSRYFWLSCLFLAGLGVLKPYFLPLYIFYPFFELRRNKAEGFKLSRVLNLALISGKAVLPLLILLLPWTIRNFMASEDFIPLQKNAQAGYFYPQAELKLRALIASWGEDHTWWERTSAGCVFFFEEEKCDFEFSKDVLLAHDKAELLRIGKEIQHLRKNYSWQKDLEVSQKIEELISDYKEAFPFNYYFVSRMKLFQQFLFHKGTYHLPFFRQSKCFSYFQLAILAMQSVLYWINLIAGTLGLLYLVKKTEIGVYLVFIPLLLVLLFPLIFGHIEWRYFHHAYPILGVGVMAVCHYLASKLKAGNEH